MVNDETRLRNFDMLPPAEARSILRSLGDGSNVDAVSVRTIVALPALIRLARLALDAPDGSLSLQARPHEWRKKAALAIDLLDSYSIRPGQDLHRAVTSCAEALALAASAIDQATSAAAMAGLTPGSAEEVARVRAQLFGPHVEGGDL